jgi:hypothetical protein
MIQPHAERSGGPRFLGLVALVAAAAASRFLVYAVPGDAWLKPYLWNFTPVLAIALFGGAAFAGGRAAALVPLAVLVASDLLLHLTGLAPLSNGAELTQQLVTYVLVLGFVAVGRGLRDRSPAWLPVASLASSVAFFLVTNAVYWLLVTDAVPPEFRYPKTLAGLGECYTKALPFFRNAVLGDLVYVAVLFGGWALAEAAWPALRRPALETVPVE